MPAVKLPRRPALLLMAGDVILAAFSIAAALFLRMEFELPPSQAAWLPSLILLSASLKIAALAAARMYSVSLAFIGLRDALRLCAACLASSALFAALFLILRSGGFAFVGFPLSAVVIEIALFLPLAGFWRFSHRFGSLLRQLRPSGKRTVIVGAGSAADSILRTMLQERPARYFPVALVDDDPAKRGLTLHGVPVAGSISDLPALLAESRVSTVVVAMPSAPASAIARAYELARSAGVLDVFVLPPLPDLLRPDVGIRDLRRIELRDLLRREEIKLDRDALLPFYRGRTVLVTGAAGSIGSELCRQLCRLSPAKLVLLDREETSLFRIHEELKAWVRDIELVPFLADVARRDRLAHAFAEHRPRLVLHAAAYKHVPLLETNAREALANNVGGTLALACECAAAGVEKFVFVSTDKAADPVSVMGKTKRIGELIARGMDKPGGTRFVSVRFGNVLGSRGSVLETFADQIRAGGPLTLTSEEVSRWFMLVSEAAMLVLHAAALGTGGETFVLDMGEPIRIRDLAAQMARMAGLELGRDIPVRVVGLRPGEKLRERLFSDSERREPTPHPRLFRAEPSNGAAPPPLDIAEIERAIGAANGRAEEAIDRLLERLEGRAAVGLEAESR